MSRTKHEGRISSLPNGWSGIDELIKTLASALTIYKWDSKEAWKHGTWIVFVLPIKQARRELHIIPRRQNTDADPPHGHRFHFLKVSLWPLQNVKNCFVYIRKNRQKITQPLIKSAMKNWHAFRFIWRIISPFCSTSFIIQTAFLCSECVVVVMFTYYFQPEYINAAIGAF